MLQGKSQCGSKLLQALCFRSFRFLCGNCSRSCSFHFFSCNFLLELYPAAKVPQADAKATSCLRSKSSCKACTSKFAPAGWRVAKENKWTEEVTWNHICIHEITRHYPQIFGVFLKTSPGNLRSHDWGYIGHVMFKSLPILWRLQGIKKISELLKFCLAIVDRCRSCSTYSTSNILEYMYAVQALQFWLMIIMTHHDSSWLIMYTMAYLVANRCLTLPVLCATTLEQTCFWRQALFVADTQRLGPVKVSQITANHEKSSQCQS